MRAARSLSLGNPLPVSLPNECKKASNILRSFVDPVNGLDRVIPTEVIKAARGFAIFTVVKGGFIFSARAGSGVVIARLPDGTWSAPSAIGTAGVGFGGQAGAEITEFILVLNSKASVKTFMSVGQLSLGGNMSVAVGPLGRNAEGSGTLNAKGKVAAIFSYSKTKGLFGGVSIEGSVIVERADANHKAYGSNVTAKQLLSGHVDSPDFAQGFVDTVTHIAGTDLDSVWIDDAPSPDRPGFEGSGYSFSSPHAAMGSDTNSGRPRASSRASSRLGGLSKFSPSFSRTNSSSSYSNRPVEDSSSYARYDSEEDASGGMWAADMRKSASQSWRESSAKFDGNLSSDDENASHLAPPNAPGRSRSGTITPRKPVPQDPFAASADNLTRASAEEGDVFGDSNRPSSHSPALHQREDDGDLFDPRRGSLDSAHTINSNHSDSSADDFGQTASGRGKFMFQGKKIKQERAALNGGDFAPSPPPRPKVSSNLGAAVALYDFTGQEEGDLSFKKGDRIEVLKKPPGEEWWVGKIGLRQGILPKNYVLLDD